MHFTKAHVAAIACFSLWGLFPLYWKIFPELRAWDLFSHRLIWSLLTLLLLLFFKKRLGSLRAIWRNTKVKYMLILSAFLISSNWLIYIYAIETGKVIEASMGYFLNPLINVFVGWLIIKEKVRATQWPSIIVALLAIVLLAVQTSFHTFPWIAITLSLTFALYGIIRKLAHVGSLEGLSFETIVVIIPLITVWSFQETSPIDALKFIPNWKILVLTLAGLVTSIPLMLFAFAARNLEFKTLGFIGYLSPSLKFLCGYLILGESLSNEKLQTFVLIWIALAWYTVESYLFIRKSGKPVPITE